jgi:hypothetical protein
MALAGKNVGKLDPAKFFLVVPKLWFVLRGLLKYLMRKNGIDFDWNEFPFLDVVHLHRTSKERVALAIEVNAQSCVPVRACRASAAALRSGAMRGRRSPSSSIAFRGARQGFKAWVQVEWVVEFARSCKVDLVT